MPEWAARQLLHPEERRGREGKEGERGGRDGRREGCRPVGGRSRELRSPPAPGAVLSPPPRPRSPGEGGIPWGSGGTVDGTERARDWDTDKRALG